MRRSLREKLRKVSRYPFFVDRLLLDALEENKNHFLIDPDYVRERKIYSDQIDLNGSLQQYQLLQFKVSDQQQQKKKVIEIFVNDGKDNNFIDKIIKHAQISESLVSPKYLKVYDSYFLDKNEYFYLIEYEDFEFLLEKSADDLRQELQKELVHKFYGTPNKSDPKITYSIAYLKSENERFYEKYFSVNPMIFGIYSTQKVQETGKIPGFIQVDSQEEIGFQKSTIQNFMNIENNYVKNYSEIIKYFVETQDDSITFYPKLIDSKILTLKFKPEKKMIQDLVIERFASMEEANNKKEKMDKLIDLLKQNQTFTGIQKYGVVQINQQFFIVSEFDFYPVQQQSSRFSNSNFINQFKLGANILKTINIMNQYSLYGDLLTIHTQYGESTLFLNGFVFFQNSAQLNPQINNVESFFQFSFNTKGLLNQISSSFEEKVKNEDDSINGELSYKYFENFHHENHKSLYQKIITYFQKFEDLINTTDFNQTFKFSSRIMLKVYMNDVNKIGVQISEIELESIPTLIDYLNSNQDFCDFFQIQRVIPSQNIKIDFSISNQYLQYLKERNYSSIISSKSNGNQGGLFSNQGSLFNSIIQTENKKGGLFSNLNPLPNSSKPSLFDNLGNFAQQQPNISSASMKQKEEREQQELLSAIKEDIDTILTKFNLNEDSRISLKEQVLQLIQNVYQLDNLQLRSKFQQEKCYYFCKNLATTTFNKQFDQNMLIIFCYTVYYYHSIQEKLGIKVQSFCPSEIINQVFLKMLQTQKKVKNLFINLQLCDEVHQNMNEKADYLGLKAKQNIVSLFIKNNPVNYYRSLKKQLQKNSNKINTITFERNQIVSSEIKRSFKKLNQVVNVL